MKLSYFAKFAVVAAMALSTAACGNTVEPGYVGVKVKTIGNDVGVQTQPVRSGWNFVGFGEQIIEYPTTQKVYTFSQKGGDVIVFSDKSGMNVWGDVALTISVDPALAPKVYEKYRLDINELVANQIRNSVRAAMQEEGEHFTSEELYQGGKSTLIQNALLHVQKKWAGTGIKIIDLQWSGTIHYPDSVVAAIESKTAKAQEAEAAKAEEAKQTALAGAAIAKAKGEAEATRIKGEALRANPQVLQQEWIARWNGELPSTLMGGAANTVMMVTPK